MSDLKRAATDAAAEILTNPKTGIAVGGASGFISSINPNTILTVMSVILVTVSLVNQINAYRDRKRKLKTRDKD